MANVDYDGQYAASQANQMGLAMGQIGQAFGGVQDPGHCHGIFDPGHSHSIAAPPMMHPDDFNRLYGGSESDFEQEMRNREATFRGRLQCSREAEFKKMAQDIMSTKQLPKAKNPRIFGSGSNDVNPLKDDPNAGMILRDGPAKRFPVLMKAKVPLAVKQVKKALPSMIVSDHNPSSRYQAWLKE